MGDNRFNRALFGISPQKVSSYLRQLKNLQDKELSELVAKVQAQQAEQQRLLAERDELYARRNAQTAQFDCQDVIMQRVPEAVRVMQQHTQQEIANLQAQIEQRRREHQWKLENIERQTESYNQALQELITELGVTMAKLNTTTFNENDVFQQEQTVAVAQEEHVAPVAAIGDVRSSVASETVGDATVEEQHTPIEAEESADAELAKSDNVIQFKVKAVTQRAARLRNRTNDWLDAGEQPFTQAHEVSEVATHATVQSTHAFTSPILPVNESIVSLEPSSFWGDIGQFVSGGLSVQEVAEDLRASMELPVAHVAPQATTHHANAAPATSAPTTSTHESPASPHVYEAAASKESEAVSTEIASIRNRYIVGKVAGEDLLDGQGRLIVAKGEVISAEVVEIAERAGKLPDLIVNMKIPGVSLDKA